MITRLFLGLGLLFLGACTVFVPSSRYVGTPMFVATGFDRAPLSGTWYDVASFPAWFTRSCPVDSMTFAAQPDGSIGLTNTCRSNSAVTEVRGSAQMIGQGRFRVRQPGSFVPQQYWVLHISRDGQMMILGTPNREAGWVLRRQPSVTPYQMDTARDIFEANGYDIAALQRSRR